MHINKIIKDDYEEWIRMGCKLHDDCSEDEVQASFKETYNDPRQETFICKNDDKEYLGFVDISIRQDYVEGSDSSPVGYIEHIYVKPEYRRQGVARKLAEVAEKWASRKGCIEIGSDTYLGNIDSRNFHRSIGFKETSKLVCFIKKLNKENGS